MSDHYAELGVKRDASEKEIQNAYLKLAMRHHPDRMRNKSEEERLHATKNLSA